MYNHHHNLILFYFILAASLGMQNLSSNTKDPTCAPCSGSVVLYTVLPGKSHHNVILEHCQPLPPGETSCLLAVSPISSLGQSWHLLWFACSGHFIYMKLYNMCSFASSFVHLRWHFQGHMYHTPSLLFRCSTISCCMGVLQFVYPSTSWWTCGLFPFFTVAEMDAVALDQFTFSDLTYHSALLISIVVQSLSCVRIFASPSTEAHQASLTFTIFRSLLKLTSIDSVMPSNHLILCCPLLLLPSIFPSIRVFFNESALCIRWPKYRSFSLSSSPSSEYSGLISFRIDWFGLPLPTTCLY